jgi:hypothetical protein
VPALPLLLSAAAAAAPSIERVEADLAWLVEAVGPRPPGSTAEMVASIGVGLKLIEAGWSPMEVGGLAGNLIACRGAPRRLFLAHLDSVRGSPGAVDNAAAVALALELARSTAATDLCVGFPVEEEAGLVGSSAMAEAAFSGQPPFEAGPPGLVVAMDLVGHGDLAVMGLGAPWGDAGLRWLVDTVNPLPKIPYTYRVYSRAFPGAERSDHGPFLERGVPALLLLGQGEGEVFPDYHQPSDVGWERPALEAALQALEQLAAAPLPPAAGPPAPWSPADGPGPSGAGLVALGWLLPSPLVWALVVAGLLNGAADARRALELPRQMLVGAAGAGLGAALMAACAGLGLLPSAPAELTAAVVMDVPPTGWWSAAPFAGALGLGALLLVRWRLAEGGSAPLGSAVVAASCLAVDPLVALPFAVGGLLSRLHPALAAAPALILLRPDALRQLSFHGLVPPLYWGLLLLLAWPAAAGRPRTE